MLACSFPKFQFGCFILMTIIKKKTVEVMYVWTVDRLRLAEKEQLVCMLDKFVIEL